ncbi:MAG: hypothetical protein FWE07_07190 [Turicibacter sp.]|nr:hypothetical protein [Turicibacter sp.]
MIAIFLSSNEQKNIESKIENQYDQLLKMCEKTKIELKYLSKDVAEHDFARKFEIDKISSLISSMQRGVEMKKQHLHDAEIENHYAKLLAVYESTQQEIAKLEHSLQKTILEDVVATKEEKQEDLSSNSSNTSEKLYATNLPEPKRERLNLKK